MPILPLLLLFSAAAAPFPGDWPEPRQNGHLTALQPLAGDMKEAPSPVIEFSLGQSPLSMQIVRSYMWGSVGYALNNGALYRYSFPTFEPWKLHPPGLNFTSIEALEDFDRDGHAEILLKCARVAEPYGAVALVSGKGTLLWQYDVEPMSYSWTLHVGDYLPDTPGKEIIVLMQGYPPDEKFGYIALFTFQTGQLSPTQLWRYDFDSYTCFPSLLQGDIDDDLNSEGKEEIVVVSHSKMWCLDAETGIKKYFVEWEVAPANVRSYGLVKFIDLDGDFNDDDFLCIADFSQHHEVLLNKDGKMEKAWSHGWPESVTTGKVETVYPEQAVADVDGDGRKDVVLSMFNSEGEADWLVRVYDAQTGELKHKLPGAIVQSVVNVDRGRTSEILVDVCHDPTRAKLEGAKLLSIQNGEWKTLWADASAHTLPLKNGRHVAWVEIGGDEFSIEFYSKDKSLWLKRKYNSPQKYWGTFSKLPPIAGPGFGELLAADLFGDEKKELLLYQGHDVRVFSFVDGALNETTEYTSTCLPVISDLDGDKKNEIVLVDAAPEHTPILEAKTPSLANKTLWRSELPKPDRSGLPHGRLAYLRTAHFNGLETPDLYLWAGTPLGRSVAIKGTTGEVMWEKGEVGGASERYWGATTNYASAFDFDKDGAEDLVFTNPDYYCVASGKSGEFLLGPAYPPTIFSQPSQGLYTYPAILPVPGEEPLVALVAGHYFQAGMSLHAQAKWYALPKVGDARCAMEAFAEIAPGEWIMGFGRQNGHFGCLNMKDGSPRWDLELDGAATDAITCDVDGDGKQEFVFATSHGTLYAVGDGGNVARIVWTLSLGAAAGPPIAADIDADGKSEIIIQLGDGRLQVLGKKP